MLCFQRTVCEQFRMIAKPVKIADIEPRSMHAYSASRTLTRSSTIGSDMWRMSGTTELYAECENFSIWRGPWHIVWFTRRTSLRSYSVSYRSSNTNVQKRPHYINVITLTASIRLASPKTVAKIIGDLYNNRLTRCGCLWTFLGSVRLNTSSFGVTP